MHNLRGPGASTGVWSQSLKDSEAAICPLQGETGPGLSARTAGRRSWPWGLVTGPGSQGCCCVPGQGLGGWGWGRLGRRAP